MKIEAHNFRLPTLPSPTNLNGCLSQIYTNRGLISFGTLDLFPMSKSHKFLNSNMGNTWATNVHNKYVMRHSSPFRLSIVLRKMIHACIYSHVAPINILPPSAPTNIAKMFICLPLPSCHTLSPPHYTLIHACVHNNHHPENTIPSCLLPCTCFLPSCKCLTHLRP